jgi:cystathionine beta-lyase/cystathionine gamma-synthase
MPDEHAQSFETACVHAGDDVRVLTTPVAPPLYPSAVYELPNFELIERAMDGEPGYFGYARSEHPNAAALESAVASLEQGEAAVTTSSGMAAIATLMLAALRPGDHVVVARDLYGSTTSLLTGPLARYGIATTAAAAAEVAAYERAFRPETKLVFVETVSNPLVRVADIAALAALARARGALLAVDASFTSPALSRPLAQGADVVVHSATKYLSGHSDVTAGVVVGRRELMEQVRAARTLFGGVCSPLDAWLTLRGLRTLALRMERHTVNAQRVAEFLVGRPEVRRVCYAGLADDTDHALAVRVLPGGAGGMLSFEVDGGTDAVGRFVAGLEFVRFAPSLGDVSTTISHPATTSHRSISRDERARLGIGDGLIRVSVGIESADDICADLARGLSAL